ncbi:MAG: S8 family serine peptidase [Gammaproteobacteria bacterium]|nr:S8 family serine peptidase [Gammaproteobacteria bacterium]
MVLITTLFFSTPIIAATNTTNPDDEDSGNTSPPTREVKQRGDTYGPVANADKTSENKREKQLPKKRARVVNLETNTVDNAGDEESEAILKKRYGVRLSNGKLIHSTNKIIGNLKTISVPNDTMQLYTWDESQNDGTTRAHYAISRDGKSLTGRIRSTSHNVKLRGHSFDPLKRVPTVPATLSATEDNELYLVQFHTTALPEFRKGIKALSGKIHRYLADHTFIVEMNKNTHQRVSELPYVRWVGPYHPEYRLEKPLRDSLNGDSPYLKKQRYSIMLTERGKAIQNKVKQKILNLGGSIDLTVPKGYRIEATLTHSQLQSLVQANEVQFIDRWGGPGEADMNIVRDLGGADYIEGLEGWSGQGVRGEIFDSELRTTHQEWLNAPIIHSTGTTGFAHGTSVYSNVFAQGIDADARGMLPDGQGIFFRHSESSQFGGTVSRYDSNEQLIDPNGTFRAVFQTSSIGSTRTTDYTTISAEVDDYLFQFPILSLQSQSNAGARPSRPQAWAKNIVSIGAFHHKSTTTRNDDEWFVNNGGSIGPADDGRIKPDLSFFYDGIRSANNTSDTSYGNFGGTSSSTPQTAGHFGLLFQMWHEGVWQNFGQSDTVFDSRPQMATAKALMINQAFQYDWNSGGDNASLNRNVQGWGTADVRRLYDNAARMSIVDESDPILPLETNVYTVHVEPNQADLRVTMVYTDPMGTVGAVVDRINDLSLRVTSPSGVLYWGNNGLAAGNTSTPGGSSNTVDTVENVILLNPESGVWMVEIIADDLVQDARTETTIIDADYGLVVTGGQLQRQPEIALPTHSYTYSSSIHTRGYWFTAPTNFTLTGLQVPDEAGHGMQNIEVVKYNAGTTPTTYPTTSSTFTSLARVVGVSSLDVIDLSLPIAAGDVIGILGAAGDSSIMHNSYGAGNFSSSVLGYPITLQRLGMQSNLATTPTAGLFTASGSIARVRMFYGPAENAITMPAYVNTFSNATRTRGHWFTAPTDFVITGLQAPDEAGHGTQHVELVRFNSGIPPTFSSTTNAFTSLARRSGIPSNEVANVYVPVKTGDIIGVLGASGDSTIMHNSYAGIGPLNTTILGINTPITRLGMQYNLATFSAQDLWTENSSVGRVQLYYSVPHQEVVLPAFSYTFSANLTRGYWFTAPVDFVITGMRVPDETGAGLQNIEVVRFDEGSPPPLWSGTTNNFTSLARRTGVPSSEVINVEIPVKAGDLIGILGAAGNATIMHNSYGAGPHTTSIFGHNVTFARMGMQYNMVTTPAQNIWSQTNGNIGRVELFYKASNND